MRRAPLSLLLATVLLAGSVAPIEARPEAGPVEHVVVIGMDNYHLEDIQAHMPNLWGFLQRGALSTHAHHPDLPTRTAPDFSSIASGQYPGHHGAINNTFFVRRPAGPEFRVGFAYWENLAHAEPPIFLSDPPWVPFNQAGWDVGAVGFEGLVLESEREVNAHLGRPPADPIDPKERDRYWGIALHRADGSAAFGSAEIPFLDDSEFHDGWVNGWSGPPRKHASITLPMTVQMQAASIPITFTYVENVHTRCGDQPPCEFDLPRDSFVDLLEADDAAFAEFFADLAALRITSGNTLFVITTDEGDHYVHEFARPINVQSLGLSNTGSNVLLYDPAADRLADGLAALEGVQQVATPVAMKVLHISEPEDARTPTFMAFSDAQSTFRTDDRRVAYRWNHGNIHPDIADIWLGLVGPGIRSQSLTAYSDQADIIPTLRAALGIPNDRDTDGVAVPVFPPPARGGSLGKLREAYKQINAPLGKLGMAVLALSTRGVFDGPQARAEADARIAELSERRDALASEMRAILDGRVAPDRHQIKTLLRAARALLGEADEGDGDD